MEVSLDEVIKKKAPGVYDLLPRFVLSILKKIIRQDRINDVLRHSEGRVAAEFITSSLDYMGVARESVDKERVPHQGRYLFASNHPLGGLDGLVLVEAISDFSGGAKIVVNDVLMIFEALRPCFIPVNKFGRQSAHYSINFNNELASDVQVIFFPAGMCSRKIKGQIADLAWQKTFLQKAIESDRDIVPVYVDARNTYFFYWLSGFRKFFGIKANLEMILLPSEMFRMNRGRKIRVVFGSPISIEEIKKSELSIVQWTEIIRKKCYDLKPEKYE